MACKEKCREGIDDKSFLARSERYTIFHASFEALTEKDKKYKKS